MGKYIIGIDLGGTSIKFAILTTAGEIQDKWSIPTNSSDEGRHIVPEMIASIQEKFAALQLDKTEFLGIGMGSPGVVDRFAGTVEGAYNLNWKTRQALKAQFEDALGLPFFIDNDANCAALGEQWLGAGDNAPDVIFVTLGTGVGGGIVADGHLIHGVAGAGGEIGHMPVEFDTPFSCTCGLDGCLETVASATGIVNLAQAYAVDYVGESQLKVQIDQGQAVTAKDVFDLAKASDALALEVVAAFSRYLGRACASMANLLNPSHIVIGGGVSAAGDFLLDGVRQQFEQHAFPQVKRSTQLTLAKLGNDAGVIGAASLVLK